jgi:hypothetical protein
MTMKVGSVERHDESQDTQLKLAPSEYVTEYIEYATPDPDDLGEWKYWTKVITGIYECTNTRLNLVQL